MRKISLPQKKTPDTINLIIGSTGSIASIKIPELITRLTATNKYNILLLPSPTSLSFFSRASIPPPTTIFLDADEWTHWTSRGDDILHIELRKWSDICLVAPLSANTLAKLSSGICDSILLEVVRAWDYGDRKRKLVCAPAMNMYMWTNPLTAPQMRVVEETLGFRVLGPIEKTLMCGDVGIGGMVEVADIVEVLSEISASILHESNLGIEVGAGSVGGRLNESDIGGGSGPYCEEQTSIGFERSALKREGVMQSAYDQRLLDQLDEE